MARIDETGAYGVDTNTEDGHEVYYHFNIFGIDKQNTESINFIRDYETMCRELPTLWKIGVRFQRASSFKTISCRLSIKRIDSSPIAVRISSTVAFFTAQRQPLGRILNFPMMIIIREQEVNGIVDPVLTPAEITSLFGQELKVRVALQVTYCHRTRPKCDPVTNITTGVRQMVL